MKKIKELQPNPYNQEFIKDYEQIVVSSENTVLINTEWSKSGDIFKKLSMYDNNYSPVLTLGGTTLIKPF
jgi:hypothetical protein